MQIYHPSKTPLPEDWLNLEEEVRIDLVKKSHEFASVEFENGAIDLHSVIHVVVENQLAMKVVPVPETIAKLTRQGLSRHEAIHAIGAIISENLIEMMKNNQTHNAEKYRKRLNKLTAKRWSRGKY